MAIAAPELAAIVAASRPAPPQSGGGGAQVVFGLLLLAVGIFLAWLFSTGRLKAVQTAIATGVAPTALATVTPAAGGGTTTTTTNPGTAAGSSFGMTLTTPAPAQAGGVGIVQMAYDEATGTLSATPITTAAA